MKPYRKHVFVCTSKNCSEYASELLHKQLKERLRNMGLHREIRLTNTGCLDECENGPVVVVYPEGIWYSRVAVDDVDEIITEHLIGGRIIQRLLYFSVHSTEVGTDNA